MRTVHKYPLALSSAEQCIKLPADAKIVEVHDQFGLPALWADVALPDVGEPELEARDFLITPTGHPVPPEATHVGTTHSAGLVWHVWEVTR